MGTLTKTFVILNLVFSVAFVMVTATVLSQRQHWKKEYLDLEDEHNKRTNESREKEKKLTTDLENVSKARAAAQTLADRREDQLTARDTKIREQEAAIAKLEAEKADANEQAKSLSLNVDLLTRKLGTAQDELTRTRRALGTTRTELDQRNTTVMALRSELAANDLRHKELLQELAMASEQIERHKKYVALVKNAAAGIHRDAENASRPGGVSADPPTPIRATVQAVDVTIGVAVLNVGSQNLPPVKRGYRFLISRGGEFIARVEVKNVDSKMCATEVIPPTDPKAVIQVGDAAVTE